MKGAENSLRFIQLMKFELRILVIKTCSAMRAGGFFMAILTQLEISVKKGD